MASGKRPYLSAQLSSEHGFPLRRKWDVLTEEVMCLRVMEILRLGRGTANRPPKGLVLLLSLGQILSPVDAPRR